MTRYEQGFLAKCAKYGVPKQVATQMLKQAEIPLEQVHTDTGFNKDTVASSFGKPATSYTKDEADNLRHFWANWALQHTLAGKPIAAFPVPKENDYNPEYATTPQYLGSIIAGHKGGGTLGAELTDAPLGRKVETEYPFTSATSNVVNKAIFDRLRTPATAAQTNNVYNAIRAGLGK